MARAVAVLIVAIVHLLGIDALLMALRTAPAAPDARPFQVLILRRSWPQLPQPRVSNLPAAALSHPFAPVTPIPVDIALTNPPGPSVTAPAPDVPQPEPAARRPTAAPAIVVLHGVRPIVPATAIQAGERGVVLVAVLVDEQGRASALRVLRSTGYRDLDAAATAAIRQWRFSVPTDGTGAIRAWTRVEWQFAPLPPELSQVALSVLPFDAAMAAHFRAAAPGLNTQPAPAPRGAQALRRMVNALREFERQAVGPTPDATGPALPIEMLGAWGAVKSLQFRGSGSGGLNVAFEQAVVPASSFTPEHTSWERYEVTQQGGVSEWLLAVLDSGAIRSAQAMTCTESCVDP